MPHTWLLDKLDDLSAIERRREAARDVARELGADDLLIFVKDADLGHVLPAPGFPQTLPAGRLWRQFLQQCQDNQTPRAVLPFPDSDTPSNVIGITLPSGAVLVFLGGHPDLRRIDNARDVLTLLTRLLHGERSSAAAAGLAAASRQAASQASLLATALDAARQELHDALNAADQEIAKRKVAEQEVARLWATEQQRSERLFQVAIASQQINAAQCLAKVLQVIADQARQLTGAASVVSHLCADLTSTSPLIAASTYETDDATAGLDLDALYQRVCAQHRPLRLSRGDLSGDRVDRRTSASHAVAGLAMPLINRRDECIGFILLWNRTDDDFTIDDEAILVQLVNVASGAIENAQLYERLMEADRRKDEFLAMLGHELRNPLVPIRSGLEVLALESSHDSSVITMMQDQVTHVVRLVDDLLEVSRIIQGRVNLRCEPVQIAVIVRQAIEGIQPMIDEHRHHLSVSLPEHPLWLNADRVRLVQVIGNFLNNAAKYSDPGSRIQLSVLPADTMVRIVVEDNGIGIEPSLLPKIFDLFTQSTRTLDRSQGGLGIGLTLAKQLVEMHHGRVAAHSDGLGTGSRFEVELPLIEAPSLAGAATSQATSTNGHRVLVVDDHVGSATMVSRLVGRLGPHQVVLSHTGPAAMEMARQFNPELILLDIGLPEMDGLAVARQLRKEALFRDTLLVALTGYGLEEDRQKSLEAGFDEHLVKPISLATLRDVLTHPKLQRSGNVDQR